MFEWYPRREPLGWVIEVEVGGSKLGVFIDVVPSQGGMVGVNVRSRNCDPYGLWCILLVCNKTLDNLEVGNVDMDLLGLGVELLKKVFTKSVGDVSVNRLLT